MESRRSCPGNWLVVDSHGAISQGRYWDLLEHATPHSDGLRPATSQGRVAELLRESVALHLVSDVPVGAFLSGGIDSSAVVGLMREAGHVPHTFSVGFAAERAYDETRHARRVAARFQAEHTEILLTEDDLLAQLPHALSSMDQPTGDGINTYVVARGCAGGITVALSGLGGDELFAGYPSFARLSRTAQFFRTWGRAP